MILRVKHEDAVTEDAFLTKLLECQGKIGHADQFSGQCQHISSPIFCDLRWKMLRELNAREVV